MVSFLGDFGPPCINYQERPITFRPSLSHVFAFVDHFSGPGRAVGPMCVCVCVSVCVPIITFELNNL